MTDDLSTCTWFGAIWIHIHTHTNDDDRIFTCLTSKINVSCTAPRVDRLSSFWDFIHDSPFRVSSHTHTHTCLMDMLLGRGVNIVCYNLRDFHFHIIHMEIKWTICLQPRWYCFVEEAHLEIVWRGAKTWVKIPEKLLSEDYFSQRRFLTW